MKRYLPLFIAAACLSLIALVGCVTRNPDYPQTSADPYVISTQLTNVTETIRAVNTATAPVNPYSPLTTPLVEYGVGIAALIAAEIARRKNAEAKKQKAAADSLAETVVKANLTVDALRTAGANGVAETVASHIDYNSPS